MFELHFLKRERLSDTTWSYTFLPMGSVDYIAGQYARFYLPANTSGGVKEHRIFTLTSIPGDKYITFAARHLDPASDYKRRLMSLKPGDSVWIDEPMGDVILPLSTVTPLLFIAGGIGIASFIPLLRQIEAERNKRDVTLLYSMRSEADRTFGNLLDIFPFTAKREYQPPEKINIDDIISYQKSPTTLFYISGTEQTVERIRRELEMIGISHSRIVFDYFTGY